MLMNKRDMTPGLVTLHSTELTSKTSKIRKLTIEGKEWFFGRGMRVREDLSGFPAGK